MMTISGDVLFLCGLAGKRARLKWYQNVRSFPTPSSTFVSDSLQYVYCARSHVQYVYGSTFVLSKVRVLPEVSYHTLKYFRKYEDTFESTRTSVSKLLSISVNI